MIHCQIIQMLIVDVGSGHGYKHAFAFGEQVAQHTLTNKSEFEVEKIFGSFFEDIEKLALKSKIQLK